MTDMHFRSLLFVPAHNTKLMESAIKTDADVLLLDLEDSVQPFNNKQLARDQIAKYIADNKLKNHLVFPRINDRESGELLKDVYQLTLDGITGFMYPKAKTGKDIYFIDKLLETIEFEKKYPKGTFKLIPLIETTAAVLNVQDICKASKRVVAIAFGCEDFVTDLGGIHDKEGLSIFTPRAIIAMAARENKICPIDTVHIKVHDLNDLEENLKLSVKLGYEGMLILHPKEIPLVHQYYSPTEQAYLDALEILELYEKSQNEGRGVAVINNKFIGPPMVAMSKRIIKKYKSLNHLK